MDRLTPTAAVGTSEAEPGEPAVFEPGDPSG